VGSTRAVGNVGSASSDSSDVGRVDSGGRPAGCDDLLSWDRVGLVGLAGLLVASGLGGMRLLLGDWADGGGDGDGLGGDVRSGGLAVGELRAAGSHSSDTGGVDSRGRPGGSLGWLSGLRLSLLMLGWLRLSRLGLGVVLLSHRADGSRNSDSLSGNVGSRCLAVRELGATSSDGANAGGVNGGSRPSSSLGRFGVLGLSRLGLSRLRLGGLRLGRLGLSGLGLSVMLLSDRANSGRDSNGLSSDVRSRLLAVGILRSIRSNSADGSRVDS